VHLVGFIIGIYIKQHIFLYTHSLYYIIYIINEYLIYTQWDEFVQIYSYSKTNKMHLFCKLFILVKHSACFERSFRPSGAQDCTYNKRHMSKCCCYLILVGTRWNSSLLSAGSSSCLTCAWCWMCSLLLLMMDGKTVRNLYSVLQE
jgi:hypothetical protein